jgi:hypothetical protein
MLIKVMYLDGKVGAADAYQLDALISSGKIRKFKRSGKWVTIGVDPIREIKEDYPGVSERKPLSKKAKKSK